VDLEAVATAPTIPTWHVRSNAYGKRSKLA